MNKKILTFAFAGTLALSACENLTEQERVIFGGLAGAAVGVITADALNANPNWVIIGALAGAAAGVLVARDYETNRCAYSNGDGTYRTGWC